MKKLTKLMILLIPCLMVAGSFAYGQTITSSNGEYQYFDGDGKPKVRKKKNKKQQVAQQEQAATQNQQQNTAAKKYKTKQGKKNSQNNQSVPQQQGKTPKQTKTLNELYGTLGQSQSALTTDSATDARGKSTQAFEGKSGAVQQRQGQNIPQQQAATLDEEAKRQAQMDEVRRKTEESQASYMKKSQAAIEQMQKDQEAARQRSLQRIEELKKKQIEERNKSANIREQQEKGTHHDAIFNESVSYEGSDEEVPAEVRAIAEKARLNGRKIEVREGETPAQARMRARMDQLKDGQSTEVKPMTGQEANRLRNQDRMNRAKGKAKQKAAQSQETQKKTVRKAKEDASESLKEAYKTAAQCAQYTNFDECDSCCAKGNKDVAGATLDKSGHCFCITSDYEYDPERVSVM